MPLNGVIEIYPKPTVVAMVTKISEYYLNINFDININLSITISIKIHSCIDNDIDFKINIDEYHSVACIILVYICSL